MTKLANSIVSTLLGLGALGCAPATPQEDEPPTEVSLVGDSYSGALCPFGSEDCNSCANDVIASWTAITKGTSAEKIRATPNTRKGTSVKDFDFRSHFEGMTRFQPNIWPSQGEGTWYAHSYGGTDRRFDNDVSGIGFSFLPAGGGPGIAMRQLSVSLDDHWAGLQALGNKLFVAVQPKDDTLTSVNILQPGSLPTDDIPIVGKLLLDPITAYAKAVGVVKMASGKYRALISGDSQNYDLIEFDALSAPGGGSIPYTSVRAFKLTVSGESVGMITECGTGRIFAIVGNGPNTGSENWWQMIELHGSHIENPTEWEVKTPGYTGACKTRFTATAFADEQNRLVVACGERQPEDSGLDWADWQEWSRR